MREYTSPRTTDVPTVGSLADDVVANAREHPDKVLFSLADREVTAAQFRTLVTDVARGLVAAGVEVGDRVVILSSTRFEWTLTDYALWFVGAVPVPVYATSPADQIAWILSDSGAVAAFVDTPEHASRVKEAGSGTSLRHVWCFDDGDLDLLVAEGVDVPVGLVEDRLEGQSPGSLATLVYTSGTTGPAKGCMLTHGAFMAEIGAATEELDALFDDTSSTLLFLPLAHVFARVVQIGAVRKRVRLGYAGGVTHLVEDLGSFRPTFVLAVPRVFEKLFNSASQRAAIDGRSKTFDRAVETAIAYSRALDSGGPGRLLRARHAVFDRLVYAKLRAALGGRCAYAVSGGAPLGDRLGHFYRGIGITVLEGYGLTETAAAATVNQPDGLKIGTVGRPLGGTGVRVDADGELLVRGPQLFSGYWRNEAATAEVLDGAGWLRTGDLGEIDDEGFVRITGRKKEILVTAGGKNVAPSALEDRLRAHPLVGQCLVVGDGRPFIAALVTLDGDGLAAWASARGKPDVADRAALIRGLHDEADLLDDLQAAVDEVNKAVSQAESIRRFTVLPGEWTEDGGHLTPSLKLRRATVLAECRREIDDLYT